MFIVPQQRSYTFFMRFPPMVVQRRSYLSFSFFFTSFYMDDDTAVIVMVDSNIQRENLLPSERAYAYKMKMDAMKHQGSRGLPTSRQVGKATGESGRTAQRFIRLTYLIPELMEMVDNRKIAFGPAVELSFLKPEEQKLLLEAMDSGQSTSTFQN